MTFRELPHGLFYSKVDRLVEKCRRIARERGDPNWVPPLSAYCDIRMKHADWMHLPQWYRDEVETLSRWFIAEGETVTFSVQVGTLLDGFRKLEAEGFRKR